MRFLSIFAISIFAFYFYTVHMAYEDGTTSNPILALNDSTNLYVNNLLGLIAVFILIVPLVEIMVYCFIFLLLDSFINAKIRILPEFSRFVKKFVKWQPELYSANASYLTFQFNFWYIGGMYLLFIIILAFFVIMYKSIVSGNHITSSNNNYIQKIDYKICMTFSLLLFITLVALFTIFTSET